jgi:hypothetical protein
LKTDGAWPAGEKSRAILWKKSQGVAYLVFDTRGWEESRKQARDRDGRLVIPQSNMHQDPTPLAHPRRDDTRFFDVFFPEQTFTDKARCFNDPIYDMCIEARALFTLEKKIKKQNITKT